VSGSHDRTVRVWDIQTRRLVYRPLVAHNYATAFVAFSFDGARIVSGDFSHTLCVWDAQTGALLFGPSNGLPVESLNFPFNVSAGRIAVAPNGKWVVYSSCSEKNHTVSVWNSEIGCSALELVDGMVWEVAFSPDGKRLAMSSSDTIRVYDWPPADI
jgi:WD40 repeat protein